jgi:hypothetical protein
MRSLNQSWEFDFESATEEAARLGSEVFGENFEGNRFEVRPVASISRALTIS